MPKVKLKYTTHGHTAKPRTKKSFAKPTTGIRERKHPVLLGKRKYAVPSSFFSKLLSQLEPHRIKEGELLAFEEFFCGDGPPSSGANLLRGLRYREHLTQREFADAIGVEQSNLSAMENGKRIIGKDVAKRIAKVFHTDYRYFL